ncbi:MAG: Mn2+/Fe2+ NRAMP family transporter [Verrucomicrobiales bacterium]|jgi:Mn2+/Fe2+ NRAMP family transporter
MDSDSDPIAQERAELAEINQKPLFSRLGFYTKRSGPGWLQGAITLGGGSLAGSLYLGVIMGFSMMWLQPFAMVLGVIMLAAISYVTLTIGRKPFGAINENLSPVLGWGWLIATVMANIVWCLPQFALGTAAVQKNLIPALDTPTGMWIISIGLFAIAFFVVSFYNSGSKGIKAFEMILKILVGIVVLSFFGVVIVLTMEGLNWGAVFKGFLPNFSLLTNPAPTLVPAIEATGGDASAYWNGIIEAKQRDKIITAFATAVGINMTFLLPYSMLRKGWGKEHRPLAIFDLSIGLIVPFVLATGCVVIAAAAQFHNQHEDVMDSILRGNYAAKSVGDFDKYLGARADAIAKENPDSTLKTEFAKIKDLKKTYNDAKLKAAAAKAVANAADASDADATAHSAKRDIDEIYDLFPVAERQLAAKIAERGNLKLADTLAPLAGKEWSQRIFGIGVFGMALSTIIILMLINGFAISEMFGVEPTGSTFKIGSTLPGLVGISGPFIWAGAAAALATPTSVAGGAMLPIAYFTFLLLMNSKAVLGDARPKGRSRVIWNVLMIFATVVATGASVWGIWAKKFGGIPFGKIGVAILAVMFIVGTLGFLKNEKRVSLGN